ncbi:phosphate ABC transporter substrate-binding protein (PhoT family) [Desulfobotulus alkaliphilus]|uniref:Phosphate ABC transporter substrate-binding protein (PhoT family) n=1 Tax=Desulfobotulus alkaliphilus TaxID=622671 RepID=A0A562RY83_9BACT|nr:phosphate ABC transporter substrate-binding protein [Desulfobotulus alkaliphilus]TWI74027.1 phosphate ABC transporter substrate-binding protein (PhoT family) [Desulfobotulus alkaliphilus]
MRYIQKIFMLSFVMIFSFVVQVYAGESVSFKGKSGTLQIAGGTAHIPVMRDLARLVMTEAPSVRIAIAGGGSGVGIQKVGEGLVDIGNSGRRPTEREIESYGLVLYRWALDGVALAVHPSNPVDGLDAASLAAIYKGEIRNWKEVGGADRAITLYTRDAASGTREVFWTQALKKGEIVDTAHVVPSNGAMKTAIAQDPGAIGYVSVGHLEPGIKGLRFDGVMPGVDTVLSGAYTVSRGLYSSTKGEATGLAADFLNYLYTPEGQAIIREKGFIPAGRD